VHGKLPPSAAESQSGIRLLEQMKPLFNGWCSDVTPAGKNTEITPARRISFPWALQLSSTSAYGPLDLVVIAGYQKSVIHFSNRKLTIHAMDWALHMLRSSGVP